MENIRRRSMMLMEKHSWLALRIIASVARRRVSNGDACLHTQTNCVACCAQAMCETAGSAAAPAARCRNCRRGSFILNLPSHHSITSSPRGSSVGGTSRPSALAVLSLSTVSYLVGACTGRSAGFSPLRNAIDIAGRLAVLVGQSAPQETRPPAEPAPCHSSHRSACVTTIVSFDHPSNGSPLMATLAFALHILGAVVWVGGMFAIYVCLRPALVTLEPPQRLQLMRVNRSTRCRTQKGFRGCRWLKGR